MIRDCLLSPQVATLDTDWGMGSDTIVCCFPMFLSCQHSMLIEIQNRLPSY